MKIMGPATEATQERARFGKPSTNCAPPRPGFIQGNGHRRLPLPLRHLFRANAPSPLGRSHSPLRRRRPTRTLKRPITTQRSPHTLRSALPDHRANQENAHRQPSNKRTIRKRPRLLRPKRTPPRRTRRLSGPAINRESGLSLRAIHRT